MSIFVQSASAAVARAIKTAGVWIAWGSGSPGWDTVAVPAPTTDTALVAEIGRRRATTVEFVTPDPAGTISVPQGLFSISSVPTDSLYVRANFANTDAVGQSIRESGIFIGTVLNSGLPSGQDYFVPGNLQNPGTLLLLERFAKITRTSDFSVSLEFVMTL